MQGSIRCLAIFLYKVFAGGSTKEGTFIKKYPPSQNNMTLTPSKSR